MPTLRPSSRRPYLIRAIHEWCCDNGLTPHIVAATDAPGVRVPPGYAKESRITLNLAPEAVHHLDLNDPIRFSARFGGRPFELEIPSGAVLAIYAQENGEGVVFGEVENADADNPPSDHGPDPDPEPPKPSRAHLRVVK